MRSGLPKRYRSARQLLVLASLTAIATIAVAQGGAQSEYDLARYHRGDTGERFDPAQALVHLRRAAEQGHVPAQADLAFLYYDGRGTAAKDLAASFRWFARAAQGGSVVAQCMLGDFHRNGWGGARQDHAEALKWYRRTAETSDRCAPKSQFALYQSYEAGWGVRKDLPAATGWLRKAADNGNPQAQYTLGRAYFKGYGVPRDAEQARFWTQKSREGVAPHDDHEHEEDGTARDAARGHTHRH